jgi:hypothetical protein
MQMQGDIASKACARVRGLSSRRDTWQVEATRRFGVGSSEWSYADIG